MLRRSIVIPLPRISPHIALPCRQRSESGYDILRQHITSKDSFTSSPVIIPFDHSNMSLVTSLNSRLEYPRSAPALMLSGLPNVQDREHATIPGQSGQSLKLIDVPRTSHLI